MLFGFIALILSWLQADTSNEQAYDWRAGRATIPRGAPNLAVDPVLSHLLSEPCHQGAVPPNPATARSWDAQLIRMATPYWMFASLTEYNQAWDSTEISSE